MENFRETKSLRNILEGLKSNFVIFKWIIYLFNPKINCIYLQTSYPSVPKQNH